MDNKLSRAMRRARDASQPHPCGLLWPAPNVQHASWGCRAAIPMKPILGLCNPWRGTEVHSSCKCPLHKKPTQHMAAKSDNQMPSANPARTQQRHISQRTVVPGWEHWYKDSGRSVPCVAAAERPAHVKRGSRRQQPTGCT